MSNYFEIKRECRQRRKSELVLFINKGVFGILLSEKV